MPETPTFVRYAEIPYDQMTPEQQEAYRFVTEMRGSLGGRRHANRVYRHAGRPCPRCGGRIAARGQGDANRTAYWCPACQL